MAEAEDARQLFDLVRLHAVDVVAFQGLAGAMTTWFDAAGTADAGAVPYFDTGRAWVAAGGPVTAGARGAIAERFVEAAAAAGRRAVFFCVEDMTDLGAWNALHIGEVPSMSPDDWALATRRRRGLKEQLRRARAKGVRAALTPAGDLSAGSPLRAAVDGLLARWVASRRIEPMAFVVAPDPYTLPEEHRYVVATRRGAVVGLLSAVPAYAGRGWLIEHLVCSRDAPNGTAESLLDALHRSLAADGAGAARVSLGLAPLSGGGSAARWHAVARGLTRPLFDFEGLRRFKSRLGPTEWRAAWLVVPPGASRVVALVDVLSAFAGGSLVRFAARSIFLRTRPLLWLLAIGLVPWTVLLLWLDLTRDSGVAGYSTAGLAGWIAFDVLLATALFRMALRPAVPGLLVLLVAALADAALSTLHVASVGLGPTLADAALRGAAVVAPYLGATTLAVTTARHARDLARRSAQPS